MTHRLNTQRWKTSKGAIMVEYAYLISFISVISLSAILGIGTMGRDHYEFVNTTIEDVVDTAWEDLEAMGAVVRPNRNP